MQPRTPHKIRQFLLGTLGLQLALSSSIHAGGIPQPILPISDRQLLRLATSHYDKSAVSNTRQVLGTYHGITLLADYPCSDVCPDYTVRIIHYAVSLGECRTAGGIVKNISVPYSIAMRIQAFCIPRILVEHWRHYVR